MLVERSGAVYAGYQSKIWVSQQAMLNNAATAAMATRLGIAVEDPDLPFVQTAGSYQGNYDLVANNAAITRLVFSADGTASCADAASLSSPLIASSSCLVSITNPESGAFTLTDVNSGEATTIAGTINYLTGALTALSTPAGSSWSGLRQ
jgi:hypothetical protein